MKRYFAFVLTLFLAACAAPSDATPSLSPAAVEQAVPSATAGTVAPTATDAAQPLQPALQATSRGDKLVVSDPVSVQVGAGTPALLEFFRFT